MGARKYCVCEDIGWTGVSVGVPASVRARGGRERGCGSAGGWVCGSVCVCVHKMTRGAWGDVYASRRGVVFLLYLAFIDRVKDPVPRNHYIFARGAWGDVCTSRRGAVFLLYPVFIDRVQDSVPRNRYIFDRRAWGDVYASRRGAVFLLYPAFIDRARDSVPRNCYIFDRGAWGDVCASRRGVVFLLYPVFIDRVKDFDHYIFDRGTWGDVCASRRGVVFLLYLAFIDRVKDPDHHTFDRGAWGDVCASRRGAVFLLYLAFIDCVTDPDHYIFDREAWGDVCASRRGAVFLLYPAVIDRVKDSTLKAKTKNQNTCVYDVLRDVCTSFERGVAFLLHLALIVITSFPPLHLKKARGVLMYGWTLLTCASAQHVEPWGGPSIVPGPPPDWSDTSAHLTRMSLEMNAKGGNGTSPLGRYDKILERSNITVDKLPTSGAALAIDRTSLAQDVSLGKWGREDHRQVADPTQPVPFTDIRLVFADDYGELYHPLLGDIIEKKIPGAEFLAPLIYAIHIIYKDLVQLETQGEMAQIAEINGNVVTWPCVASQGGIPHVLIDWTADRIPDPPMDLVWCPDKPFGSNLPDMYTASLLYSVLQVPVPFVSECAWLLCLMAHLASVSPQTHSNELPLCSPSAPPFLSSNTAMIAQISNNMLGKAPPNYRMISLATLCRPFAMTNRLRTRFPSFGENQKASTKMRSIAYSPRDAEGNKVATLRPTGTRKLFHTMETTLPNLSLPCLDESTSFRLSQCAATTPVAPSSDFKTLYYDMSAKLASSRKTKTPFLPAMPLFEMDNLVWTSVSKGFSNLKWTATGVTTLEKESGVPHTSLSKPPPECLSSLRSRVPRIRPGPTSNPCRTSGVMVRAAPTP